MSEGGEEQEAELCWCLRRIGETQERLVLPAGEEVTVGRGISVTYQLASTMCPLMISRTHCFFRQNTKGQWMVIDNNSLNGVWVNKERLEAHKPHTLSDGDTVQFGVALPNTDKAEFEYELVQESLEKIRPFVIRPLAGQSKIPQTKRKLSSEEAETPGTEVGTSSTCRSKLPRRREKALVKMPKPDPSKQPAIATEELESDVMEATQQPCANSLHLSLMRETIAELRSLNDQAQEKYTDMQMMGNPQQNPSEDSQAVPMCWQELLHLQRKMVAKRKEHQQRIDEVLRVQEDQQKAVPRNTLGLIFKNSSSESKTSEEPHVKDQLSQLLHEHALLMGELNLHHQKFEQIIQEQRRDLQETKKEKEKMEAQKEFVNHMNDVLDNELQCIICSEHFIEAVTLNCAHSFCSFCIQSWRRRKEECPMCRQQITSQTRSLVLDNCIDRMLGSLSADMRERRTALILERRADRCGASPREHHQQQQQR